MSNCPNCPNCNSDYTVESGKLQSRQRYHCNSCGRYFIYDLNLIDVTATSDSELDPKKEVNLSLLGISFGFITTAFLLLCICLLLYALKLDLIIEPLPSIEKPLKQ